VPPGSFVSTGLMGTGSTASFTPDAPGSYFVKLTVGDGSTTIADRRVFGVKDANDRLVPAFTAKADALNFGGQLRGWDLLIRIFLAAVLSIATKIGQMLRSSGI